MNLELLNLELLNSASLSSKVSGYLTPVISVPLEERVRETIVLQPGFSTVDEIEQRLVLRSRRQRCLGFTLGGPDDGSTAVAVHGHGQPLLLQQGHSVYDG